MKIDNIKLIDMNKLYNGLFGEAKSFVSHYTQNKNKSFELSFNDVLSAIENSIVEKDEPSKLNIKSDLDDLKKEVKSIAKMRLESTCQLEKDIDSLKDEINRVGKNQTSIYDSMYDNIDSLKDKIHRNLYDENGKVISTKHLRNEVDAINNSLMNKYGMIDANKLKDRIDVLNDEIKPLFNDIKSLKDDMKTINNDIEDIKCDMEDKVHENDLDDRISDSSALYDIVTRDDVNDVISDAQGDMVELSYVESIDARLKRIECGIIGRVVNSVKRAFNTLLSVRISIKTK